MKEEFKEAVMVLSVLYLPLSLFSYPTSLGVAGIFICVIAAVMSAVLVCGAMFPFLWLGERFTILESVIDVGLSFFAVASFFLVPYLVLPVLLFPLFRGMGEGALQMLGLILGIISSLITIHEFLKRKSLKNQSSS